MHKEILDQVIAQVQQRASEGDCPTTPPVSTEMLEEAILELVAFLNKVKLGVVGIDVWPHPKD